MKPPSKVKVLHLMVPIVMTEDLIKKDNAFGRYHNHLKLIEIEKKIAHPEFEREVVLHEILHSCVNLYGIHFSSPESEEQVVDVLAGALMQVMKDNPKLMRYLLND